MTQPTQAPEHRDPLARVVDVLEALEGAPAAELPELLQAVAEESGRLSAQSLRLCVRAWLRALDQAVPPDAPLAAHTAALVDLEPEEARP